MNLKEAAGQALIREMVPEVDVFIHYRPGVMDKLNLGSEALRELNPRLRRHIWVRQRGAPGKARLMTPSFKPMLDLPPPRERARGVFGR